ncbi:hypothetical protein ACIPEN_22165 [Herbaspirillum chlorophenolicum]|uniref:Uncharacterized protein n=1 Tax=Herbaspirillum chlorophenolicum TaxID=211589 RepID=A0ABW8F5H3_9BURK
MTFLDYVVAGTFLMNALLLSLEGQFRGASGWTAGLIFYVAWVMKLEG